MIDVGDFVLPASGSATPSSISGYIIETSVSNPIETFLAAQNEVVLAGDGHLIRSHPILGRLLLLGIVSAFENYCRNILPGCLEICPDSQARSAEKNVSLGGAIWHGKQGAFNRSAFEHKSLADVKELKSAFKEYIEFDLGNQIFRDFLSPFDTIMQLRHAIVHAGGYLPGRNAVKLEVPRTGCPMLVAISQDRLQECILLLSNFVCVINRELFSNFVSDGQLIGEGGRTGRRQRN